MKTKARTSSKNHSDIDTAAEKIVDHVESLRDRGKELEEQLRETGRRFLNNAKEWSDTATKQARLHPLAAIGLAFVAGALVVRVLRR